ncbi:MAG: hypothetical protein WCX95_04450 [Candidatus Gracilibacteria bacterium]
MKTKNSLLKLIGVMLISLMALAGCGKATEEVKTEEVVKEQEKVAVTYPAGCSTENSLTVKSEEAGTVTFDVNHAWYNDWGTDGAFYFMSWDGFDPKNYSSHKFVKGDVQVGWDLKTVDKTPVTVGTTGTWNYRAEKENNELMWLNISTIDLAGAVFDEKGKVEITYFGNDYVCGTVTATDSSSSLNGNFIAKYNKF